jgi:N-acetylglucosaminyldiphosphoundecaprenol N-acetyl-beta-D-mannosaminyltransferase
MAPVRVVFFDCPIDVVTEFEAIERAEGAVRDRRRFQHGDVNVAKLVSFRSNPELLTSTAASDIICADGIGIVWGCRLLGLPIRERVTGIDLMGRMLELSAKQGFRCYFLGARDDVLNKALSSIRRLYPSLDIAGASHGYFAPEEEPDIVAAIGSSRADCLFVGMSSPKKELFLSRYRDELNVPVQLGVGGAFDVYAGYVHRAPRWIQCCGLEWLFRLGQEPGRLWRRYLSSNTLYAAMLAAALARRLVRSPRHAAEV